MCFWFAFKTLELGLSKKQAVIKLIDKKTVTHFVLKTGDLRLCSKC